MSKRMLPISDTPLPRLDPRVATGDAYPLPDPILPPDWSPNTPEPDVSFEGLSAEPCMELLIESAKAKLPLFKAWRGLFVSAAKAEAREIMRIKTRRRKNAAEKQELRRARRRAGSPAKKPTQQLVTEAASLRSAYMRNPKAARTQALRRIAHDEGISVKDLRRIENRLAWLQVQQLAALGSVTLPRLGRFTLNTTGPRVRQVNVSGKIGRDGQRGPVQTPIAVGVRFETAGELRRALNRASQPSGSSSLMKLATPEEETETGIPWWAHENEDGSDASHLQRLGTKRKPKLLATEDVKQQSRCA